MISQLNYDLFLQVKIQRFLTDYKSKQNKDLKLLLILSVSQTNLANMGHSPREYRSTGCNLSLVIVYIHLIPYIPEMQIIHNRSPETKKY